MQEVIVIVVLAHQLPLQGSLATSEHALHSTATNYIWRLQSIICYDVGTGDVRLVNVPNSTMCEGRLDLYSNEKFIQGWFAVCDNKFNAEEMRVVCRRLGCPYSNGYRTNVLK